MDGDCSWMYSERKGRLYTQVWPNGVEQFVEHAFHYLERNTSLTWVFFVLSNMIDLQKENGDDLDMAMITSGPDYFNPLLALIMGQGLNMSILTSVYANYKGR